jgi:spoIIIJ-associated protein
MDFLEYSGKTVEDALTQASVQLGVTSDQIEYEVIDKGSNGILGFGSKDATIRVKKKEEAADAKDVAEAFLRDVFATMNLEVVMDSSYDEVEKVLSIDLKGPEMGIIIGKRGQTLDSLQYLVNLAVNRKSSDFVRVKIDTEDYRRRRKETLENLAKNVAYKVKRTKKSVSLEAMNPYERRIIHFALQNDSYVSTHSEGEEPYRHVVVTLKK